MFMSNSSIVVLILLCNCLNLMSYDYRHEDNISTILFENCSLTTEETRTTSDEIFTSNDLPTTSIFSSRSFFISEAPLLFSIIALTIRSTSIDQEEYFYSVDIQINGTCPSKRESNLTFIFQPSSSSSLADQTKRCLFPSKNHSSIICENLTYGVHYIIDGYLLCGTRNISLAQKKELYEITKPKYINSSSTPTSIDTLVFLPGLFSRLIIELTTVNQTCSMEYSSIHSPFYHCLFQNLTPAQWFVLNYYSLTNDDQKPSGDVTIVYTELEDLHFSCQLNETNQQIDFSWSNLTASGYSNLTISILTDENKSPWIISCDPYISQGNCSTKPYRLEAGREYQITSKLKKIFPNSNGQKLGRCLIKTNLSQIPIDSLRHEFVNETIVRLNWREHPFSVEVRLRNLESNTFEYPNEKNEKSALFIHLPEASIYRVEFNISKINYSSLIQITDYFIQTDLKKLLIENIVRLSEDTLMVKINQNDSAKIKIMYCIEQILNENWKICSTSNIFDQLLPGSIYNISISLDRDSLQNSFFWQKQMAFKLVNTDPSPLKVRTWKSNENCAAELFNTFPLSYSSECFSNERKFNCHQLRCGCRYLLKIKFNQTNLDSLCSTSPCDIQFNHPNFTIVQFQTPLETVENLRIVSMSSILREIIVDYDIPTGCFDRVILTCETIPLKQRRTFSNSTVCTDLIPNEFYRIYVETKRTGWETVISHSIETQLIVASKIDQETANKGISVQSIVIPCIIAILLILILIVSTALLFAYRRRRRKKSTQRNNQQSTTNNNTNTTTKLNNIINQVNIYSNSKQVHPTNSDKPIRIKDLLDIYEKLIANNYYNISNEFNKLQNNLQEIPSLAQCDQLFKNRYKDIIPYEHSRVKLIPVDECDPGYINASFISGLHNPREYIACQGPLKTTINDHWKMIWEQNVAIIVMLTGLVERGMNKCERYWPKEPDQLEMFGDISVCVTACINLPAYNLRYIQVKKNEDIRSIKHYTFKMWDDHTVPTRSDQLVHFIRLIRSECRPEQHGPLLVHCSAGVGRSGTFIALDRLLQQFDKSSSHGYLDIFGTVLDMRRCREKMVQNEHQYLFLYRCLKEEYERTSGNANHAIIADDPV